MIQGKDLKIKLSGSTIAYATGCNVDMDVDVIEVSSKTSGKAKEFVPSRSSWAISVNGLLGSGALKSMKNKLNTIVTAEFTDGNVTYSGSAIITKLQFTGNVKSLSKYNASLRGSGELAEVTT